ncbi:MAG: hypothetical protein ACMXYE_01250 [Candidatus Woesearchaeota archaeon]
MSDESLDEFIRDIASHMPETPRFLSRLTYPRNLGLMAQSLKDEKDLGNAEKPPALLVVRYKQNGPRFLLFGETQAHIDSYLVGNDRELYGFKHSTYPEMDTKALERIAHEIGVSFVSETLLPCVVTSGMKGYKAGEFLLLTQKYGQVITSQRYWDEVLPQPWEGRS